MTRSLIQALQEAAQRAAGETDAAASRQRTAEAALASAVAASDDAAKRRRVLDDALMTAQAAEDACRDRLGEARLQLAGTERQIEAEGDRAAAGNDTAAKAIPRLEDTRALQSQLVRAHERRTAEAETAREAAEDALHQHDREELARVAALAEQLIVATAERGDAILRDVVGAVLEMRELVQARDEIANHLGRQRADWRPELLHGGEVVHEVYRNATSYAGAPLTRARTIFGDPFGKRLAAFAAEAIGYWDAIRGTPRSSSPREEVVLEGLVFEDNGAVLMHGSPVGQIKHAGPGYEPKGREVPKPWVLTLGETTEHHPTQAAARERAERVLSAPPSTPPSSPSGQPSDELDLPPDAGELVPDEGELTPVAA